MKNFKWLSILFYFILALKALESLTIFSHGDALNYHLVIPRLVLEYGWSNVFETFFAVFLSGYFELIYLIPNFIFGNTIFAQLSGQWLQFWLSLGLSCWIFLKYIKNRQLALMACLVILTISKGGDYLLYAKNDAFLSTLCLWLFMDVITSEPANWNAKKYGIFFGLIPSVKLSGLFFLSPVFLYLAWKKRGDFKFLGTIAVIAFVIHLPIFVIKYYYLGGAFFFPALLSLFPGNLPPNTIALFNSFTSSPLTLESFFNHLKFFLFAKVILVIFLPVLYLNRKNHKVQFSCLTVGISFLLVLIMNGGVYSERFHFPMLFTLIGSTFYFLQSLTIPPKYFILAILLIFADSKIDKTIKRVFKVLTYPTQNMTDLRKKEIPLSTVWDYMLTIPGKEFTYVFSDEFVQTFYSPKGIRVDMYPSSPNTFDYQHCVNTEFLNRFSYFILSWRYNSPCNDLIKQRTEKIYQQGRYQVLKVKEETSQ